MAEDKEPFHQDRLAVTVASLEADAAARPAGDGALAVQAVRPVAVVDYSLQVAQACPCR